MCQFKTHNYILLKWEGAGREGIEPIQKMFTPTQDFSAGSLAWNIESRFVEIKNHGNGGKRQEGIQNGHVLKHLSDTLHPWSPG